MQKESIKFFIKYIMQKPYLKMKCKVDCLRKEQYCVMQEYPTEIQLPITYKCNYNCVMCGMRNLIKKEDFTSKELGEILKDKLFSKVEAVGVNGGEPMMRKDIYECFVEMIDALPNLKVFNMISNAYFTDKYASELVKIKKLCQSHNIKLNLTLSVDGIGDMQNFHRGHHNGWEHTKNTFNLILSQKNLYCDDLNIICTITKYNIYDINDVDVWAKSINVPIAYNIATVNVRIDNVDKVEDFSIFNDEHARLMAQEFFFNLFSLTKSKRYFAIYYFIKNRKRIANCPCMNNSWVTLTPNKQLGYCATHSNELGDAYENSAYDLFNNNLSHLQFIKNTYCDTCSHYIYTLNREGKKEYYKELIRNLKV